MYVYCGHNSERHGNGYGGWGSAPSHIHINWPCGIVVVGSLLHLHINWPLEGGGWGSLLYLYHWYIVSMWPGLIRQTHHAVIQSSCLFFPRMVSHQDDAVSSYPKKVFDFFQVVSFEGDSSNSYLDNLSDFPTCLIRQTHWAVPSIVLVSYVAYICTSCLHICMPNLVNILVSGKYLALTGEVGVAVGCCLASILKMLGLHAHSMLAVLAIFGMW